MVQLPGSRFGLQRRAPPGARWTNCTVRSGTPSSRGRLPGDPQGLLDPLVLRQAGHPAQRRSAELHGVRLLPRRHQRRLVGHRRVERQRLRSQAAGHARATSASTTAAGSPTRRPIRLSLRRLAGLHLSRPQLPFRICSMPSRSSATSYGSRTGSRSMPTPAVPVLRACTAIFPRAPSAKARATASPSQPPSATRIWSTSCGTSSATSAREQEILLV